MEGVKSPGAVSVEALSNAIGTPFLIAIVLLALFAVAQLLRGEGKLSRLKVLPRPLMTAAERKVCAMIERALPGARVHSQVSMGAIMQPAKGMSKSDWWKTFNRFSSKRVDFVVEDPRTGEVIMLIELDDKTHRASTDTNRDSLTKHAGYLTVRILAGTRKTQETVTAIVHEGLERSGSNFLPPRRNAASTIRA